VGRATGWGGGAHGGAYLLNLPWEGKKPIGREFARRNTPPGGEVFKWEGAYFLGGKRLKDGGKKL